MNTTAREYSSPACTLHEFEPGVRIKRAYDEPAPTDGYRVLIDRLWPRGLSKKKAALDAWARDIAPSPALRKWFAHDPGRFAEFSQRYRAELRAHPDDLETLRERAKQQPVTLLYAAKDPEVNHATVLREVINRRSESGPPGTMP